MKTLLKNLFLTGFFVFVILNVFNLPSAKATDNTDYVLLCKGIRTFLSQTLNLGDVRSCGAFSFNANETNSTCKPFSLGEIITLRTFLNTNLNCQTPNKDNINEVASILCRDEAKSNYASLRTICAYKDNPNDTNTSNLKNALTASETAAGRGGVTFETITQATESGQQAASIEEEGYCLLRDKNGVLLNQDPSPCALGSTWAWLNPFNSIPGGIFYIIYLMIRGVLVVILKVFQWLLNPLNFGGYINFLNFSPGPNNPSLVPQLWSFIKNFANLGIILGMIFTAIATILRIEKYSWKKMLPKLLLVALLVNFSLVIAGIFVDISNYIVNVTATSFNNISLSNLIVNCTLCPTVKAFYNLGGGWDLARATGLGIILSGLFFYQFIGLVFYVFIRILTIVICLITSPLAFLGFAFPGGEKIWDFWRKQFQQAIVILPVLCIVFVLSLQFINIIVSNLNNNIKPGDEGAFVIVLAYAGFVIVFAQLVRYVAKFLGVEQVEKGFQLAKKAVNTAVMAGTAAVGGAALTRIAGSQTFRNVGQGLTQLPVLNKMGYKMLDQSDAARFTNIRKSEEKMKLRDKNEILAIANGEAPLRSNKQAYADYMAARNIALRNGWLKYDSSALEQIRKDIQNKNPDLNAKDLVQAFPEYFTYGENGKIEILDTKAPDYSKKVAQNIKENISAENMPKHTEEIIKAIKKAGGNIDEFFEELVFSKTNQLRAFLDNVAEDEYITGNELTKSTGIPGPWSGANGQIATILKDIEIKTRQDYENLFKLYRTQGKSDAEIRQMSDIREAEEKWYKAQQAIDEINKKLKTSQTFQDTFGATQI